MFSLLWLFHAGIVHNRNNNFNESTRFSHFNLGGFQLIRAPLFWWEFNLVLPSLSVISPVRVALKTLSGAVRFANWTKVWMLLPWLAMCQPVFVEIIYMLPNWSEHKANCLTVKADCMFTVWPSALLLLAYLYHSDARDQYHFVWPDTNEGHTRLKCLDCLSLLIEASRFPPTELLIIKGLKLKGRRKKTEIEVYA